jgi:hypothetical protein
MKTIVPAVGDCSLLTYRDNHPDNDQEVGKWQIIAWAIDPDTTTNARGDIIVTPISNNGEEPAHLHDWAAYSPTAPSLGKDRT